MKRKQPKFKLWQDDTGLWCCSSPQLPQTWTSDHKTADLAIAAMHVILADFQQMKDHFDGTCTEPCDWCKRHPKLKGIRAKNSVDTPDPAG